MNKPYLYSLISTVCTLRYDNVPHDEGDHETFNLFGLDPNNLDDKNYFVYGKVGGDAIISVATNKFYVDIAKVEHAINEYENCLHKKYDHMSVQYIIETYNYYPFFIRCEKVTKEHILEYFKLRNSGILDVI